MNCIKINLTIRNIQIANDFISYLSASIVPLRCIWFRTTFKLYSELNVDTSYVKDEHDGKQLHFSSTESTANSIQQLCWAGSHIFVLLSPKMNRKQNAWHDF